MDVFKTTVTCNSEITVKQKAHFSVVFILLLLFCKMYCNLLMFHEGSDQYRVPTNQMCVVVSIMYSVQ